MIRSWCFFILVLIGFSSFLNLKAQGKKQKNSCIAIGKPHGIEFYFYKYGFTEVIDSSFLDLSNSKGYPVPGQFNSYQGGNVIKLSDGGDKAYFLMFHQDDDLGCEGEEETDNDTSYWLAMYVYDFKTKKIDSLFSMPPSDRLIWDLNDNQIFICDINGILKSYNTLSKSLNLLSKIQNLHSSENFYCSKLYIQDKTINVYYVKDSILHKFQYALPLATSNDFPLYKIQKGDWWNIFEDQFFAFNDERKDGNNARLVRGNKVINKYIYYNNFEIHWLNRDTLYIIEKNALSSYNSELVEINRIQLDSPHIYTRTDRGLFISYFINHKEFYGILSSDFKTLNNVSPPIDPSFPSYISFLFIGDY
jgi:hypothetical protein